MVISQHPVLQLFLHKHIHDGQGSGPYHAPYLVMRTIAWNCRGVGRASIVRALKELIRGPNSDIIFFTINKN